MSLERFEIYKYSYPFADKVNPSLHRFIVENASVEDPLVPGTMQTVFQSKKLASTKEFQLLIEYIKSLVLNIKYYIPPKNLQCKLELINWWGMIYNKGHFQIKHTHPPAHWAFVYYINTPKGSSPLVFNKINKKIIPKSGEVVIFPAWTPHQVPPNRCEGRSSFVGNFMWNLGLDQQLFVNDAI